MPFFDFECPLCGDLQEHLVRNKKEWPYHCGERMTKVWKSQPAVIQDSIEGGQTFENLGHDPVTVYSKSELKRVMKERGLEHFVRHTPTPGSDKAPHTSSWATVSKETLENAKEMLEAHAQRNKGVVRDDEGPVMKVEIRERGKDEPWPRHFTDGRFVEGPK